MRKKLITITALTLSAAILAFSPSAAFADSTAAAQTTSSSQTTASESTSQVQSCISLAPGSDESQVNFSWFSTDSTAGKVLYAKSSEVTNGALPASASSSEETEGTAANREGCYYFHQTITGLEPGTSYTYQLVNGENASQLYTFHTANAGDFSFLLVGDPQIGAGTGNGDLTSDIEGWQTTLKAMTTNDSDAAFLISAGDQVNLGDSEDQYTGYLENEYMPTILNATVVGNHETYYSGDNTSEQANYDQHYNVANESHYGRTTSGGDAWFTYNGVLFLQLNDNNMSTAQHKAFMQEAIAANPGATWKVVVMHHSLYSVANHAYDNDILTRRTELTPVFDDLGIDVVLQGHDHVYVRSYMMDGMNPITDTSEYDNANYTSTTDPDGILYITANSGSGSKYYKIKNEQFSYAAVKSQENIPTFSRISVTDHSFEVKTFRVTDNSVVDDFTINRTNSSKTMYRLYNPNSGEHFYTADAEEKAGLVEAGWTDEGTGWTAPAKSDTPVYRLYNPNAGDHHYTTSASERDNLVKAGWNYEGIGWYSDDEEAVPLYRLYNPNAIAGAHHYTTSKTERDNLAKAGWNDEGIGWYGL